MNNFILALLLVTSSALADCPNLYPNAKVINVANTVELCNSFYVSRYDAKNRAVVITSEILHSKGHGVERSNNFHPDFRVARPIKSSDYTGSGFDRGHMVPAADATTFVGMSETFLMTNMTPQNPTLNRVEWRLLEEKIRDNVTKINKPVWVVTGAIYGATPLMRSLVPVPVSYYKVVYSNPIRVYAALNKYDAKVYESNLVNLKKVVDIDF